MCVYVCVCVYVCMYVYAYMHVCMCVRICICLYVCMYVYMCMFCLGGFSLIQLHANVIPLDVEVDDNLVEFYYQKYIYIYD